MQIAPGFQSSEWKALRLDDPASPDWETAIGVLDRRIRERYFEPTDFLLSVENDKAATQRRFGFSILAIDCLLVETLDAFLEGLTDTIHQSKETFCKFLTTRQQFSRDFSKDLAEQFYYEFRCGILHQAELGGTSKVWSVGPLVHKVGDSVVVNRTEFHNRLKREFKSYLEELRNLGNAELRRNFRTKMDFIART